MNNYVKGGSVLSSELLSTLQALTLDGRLSQQARYTRTHIRYGSRWTIKYIHTNTTGHIYNFLWRNLFFSMADKYKEMKNEDDTDYLVLDDEFEPDLTSEDRSQNDHNNSSRSNNDNETNRPGLKASIESSQSEENNQDSSPDSNSTSNNNRRPHYGVMYFNHAGEATFTRDNVCTTQTEGGATVINTAHYSSNFNPYSYEKPLRKRNIKFMLAISVIAIIFFFPTGICAYHYAMKADKEFDVGIERGDIDLARKYAKKSEKFIIFSFFSAFLVAVIALAVYERFQMSPEELRKHSYHHMIAG